MDNLIFYSWIAYTLSSVAIVLGTWKFLSFLPFSLKLGIFFSQVAILAIPAQLEDTNYAPAFIVLIVDVLSRVPTATLVAKAIPLTLAILAAWPLALILGWLRQLRLKKLTARTAEQEEPTPA